MNTADLYNSHLEVDMHILTENYQEIRRLAGAGVTCIPVLKGNAYGVGLVPVAKVLCAAGADTIAIAQVREGVQLRGAGLTAPRIFVLGGVPEHLFPAAVQYDIGITLFCPATALALEAECARQGRAAFGVQIKIETGLHRAGVLPGAELAALLAALAQCPHLTVEGVFSHFADGEVHGSLLARAQYERFCTALAQLQAAGVQPPLVHLCNSGASEWFSEAAFSAIRVGRRLYMGSQQVPGSGGAIGEVCSWRASVTNLRTLQPGETVGYDAAWTAQRQTRVALICAGYSDGVYPPLAAAHAPVLVGRERAPLLGTCMDQCFADVTDIPCAVGDEVTFFGRSSDGRAFLSAQEVGAFIGDEGVFFTNALTPRVGRVYLHMPAGCAD